MYFPLKNKPGSNASLEQEMDKMSLELSVSES